MDKALACHTSGWGSIPDTTKDFVNSEKMISVPILLATPSRALSLSQWLVLTLETGDLLQKY